LAVILATPEAEIRRMADQGQSGQVKEIHAHLNKQAGCGSVLSACNPSYVGVMGRRIQGLRPAWAKK
jgi:hypothetical protein